MQISVREKNYNCGNEGAGYQKDHAIEIKYQAEIHRQIFHQIDMAKVNGLVGGIHETPSNEAYERGAQTQGEN
jgi:hypothetical protein